MKGFIALLSFAAQRSEAKVKKKDRRCQKNPFKPKAELSFISASTGDTLTYAFLHLLVKRDGGLLLTALSSCGGGGEGGGWAAHTAVKDQLTTGRLCSPNPRAESTSRQWGCSQPQAGGLGGEGVVGGRGQVTDSWESLLGLSEEVW